jgi:hypothetical protein
MELFISIDGVLRNTIQKFDYHYKDYFINTESHSEETFEYGINEPIYNDNLFNSYKFQSYDEFIKFTYFDFPIEIYGHAGLSYHQSCTELNSLIFENPHINVTLICHTEKGKGKPATLFFLSKNGVMCDSIRFVSLEKINKLWNECDLWITDNKEIINSCPKNKKVIKFNTPYNNHFTNSIEINKLSQINKECLKYSEKTITSTLMGLLQNVKSKIQ